MTITDIESIFKIGEPWPPKSEAARIATYDKNSRLYEGEHGLVWPDLNPGDGPVKIPMALNWYRRICTLFTDLLWGETPRFSADESKTIDRLVDDNQITLSAYDATIDLIKFGTAIFKIRFSKRGIIEVVNPRIWFPVVDPDNVADVKAHILAWQLVEGDETYLRAEIHTPGQIENRLYLLKGDKIDKRVDLPTVSRYSDLKEKIATGLNEFLIIPLHNLKATDAVAGRSDFEDVHDVIHEMEKRSIQISRVLDQHADPKMTGGDGSIEIDPYSGELSLPGGGRYYPITEGETPPSYITWNAELDSAFKQIESMREQLYAVAEVSPAILGETKNGLAESGSALKRLALPTLAKTNRLRQRIDPQLKKVLRIAASLEVESRMPGATKLTNLSIEWRDGLPQDLMEATQAENIRYLGGLSSRRSSIARLDEGATKADLDAELEVIEAEEQARLAPGPELEPLKLELPSI